VKPLDQKNGSQDLDSRRALREPPREMPGGLDPFEIPPDGLSRRRFLSLLSTSAALAATGVSCSRIDRGAIVPYTRKPVEVIPGVATYYASTFPEGLAAHGVLVKTREGRPIHVEGNAEHPISRGKAAPRAIADILGLYDGERLHQPLLGGKDSSWGETLPLLVTALAEAKGAGRPVLLFTGAVRSPIRKALIQDLKAALPGLRHVSWEPAAPQAAMAAERALYGEALLAPPRLDRAEVIVSLAADFLGDHGSPEAIRAFAARRRPAEPGGAMNRLWVFEGGLSLTGTNADHRFALRPARMSALAFALAGALHEKGVAYPVGMDAEALKPFALEQAIKDLGVPAHMLLALVDDLHKAGKASLVIAGEALPAETHAACHLLNAMLGAEGHTVDASAVAGPVDLASTAEVAAVLKEAASGAFAVAIFWGANPGHAFPDPASFQAAAAGIPLAVRLGLYADETAQACRVALPESHWLESWGDHQPAAGLLSLQQPAIAPLHDSRQGEDVLLELLRGLKAPAAASAREALKARWQSEVYPKDSPVPFERFWNSVLHDGVLQRGAPGRPPRVPRGAAIAEAAVRAVAPRSEAMELVLSLSAALLDGRYGNNGWLQELPHAITKMTWGNPVALSSPDAERLGLKDGDLARVEVGKTSLETQVVVQPGQAVGVASLELGYGRETGNVARAVGVNGYRLMDPLAPAPAYIREVKIASAGSWQRLPRTQERYPVESKRFEGKELVWTMTPAEWAKAAAERKAREGEARKERPETLPTLYPEQEFKVEKWGMAIDLSSCVGCGACVTACQSENNIPVVGPEQVIRGREMHWMRIDRYYVGDERSPVRVAHQPMLCQQCDNAPCENVCPVNATTHSPDGLNQMTYNRCVGTRYCGNNCPYKVRRFNFLDFTSTKIAPETLVFNPEVTVRPRGVMEKCTFCVQRIQDVRQRTKAEGRPIRDGEIRPACAVACPAEAIVFGNLNDPASEVARLSKSDRGYKMLEELGVKPSITYLADLTNPAVEGKA
jgi:Fe-S-cluster-containing dehydrogenase component/anaerobic selenocysteine-containing dehydrogenase